jgi:MoaA/NifB/PqqE/SkfB family radical SAM enzyme
MGQIQDVGGFSKYPRKLTVALTDKCNLKCFICTREEFEVSTDSYGSHMPIEHLYTLENPIRNAEVLQITGFGETFLYPHLEEALDYIYSINPREDLIYMISNGTLLSEKWGRKLDRKLNYLAISLNASNPESYRRDMYPYIYRYTRETAPKAYSGKMFKEDRKRERSCEFERTLDRIRDFMSALSPQSQENVGLHFVVTSENFREMKQFLHVAKSVGVSRVEFNPYMVSRAENIDYSIFFHKEDYNAEIDEALKLAGELGIKVITRKFFEEKPRAFNRAEDCNWPFDESIVFTPGNVAACCFTGFDFMDNAFEEGKSFDDIWFGQKYARLRRERWLDPCQNCNLSHTFDDWQTHFHAVVKMTPRYADIVGRFEDEDAQRPTKVLVVGTGRDGSRSVAKMLEQLHNDIGEPVRVLHESESFRTYDGVIDYLRTGKPDRMKRICRDWRFEVVAGNGFGFVLPALHEIYGPELKVVHLVRDKAECIRSLHEEALADPLYWTGYLEGPEILEGRPDTDEAFWELDPVRPTAPLLGEMTAAEWLGLSVEDRLAWYYDKTHEYIAKAAGDLKHYQRIETETLSRPETAAQLSQFVAPGRQVDIAPLHLNAFIFHLDGAVDKETEAGLHEVFRDLDLLSFLSSEISPLIHYVKSWVDYASNEDENDVLSQLQSLRRGVDTLIRQAESGRIEPLEDAVAAKIQEPSPQRTFGLDPERRRLLASLFAGVNWSKVRKSDVYAILFCLQRLAVLRNGNADAMAELAAVYEFVGQQVDALLQKLDGAKLAAA